MNHELWVKSVQWVGVVVGCVIEQNGKYLLVQEKQPKVYGLWNLPAGYVGKGESIESAAIRETKEESGLDIALDSQILLVHENNNATIKHVFKAHIIGGDLHAQESEILDVKWFTYDEIIKLNDDGKIRNTWMLDAIKKVHNE